MTSPYVAVIVLNWNGKTDTLETLASLRKVTYDRLRVILVDNGSSDGTAEAVRHTYPETLVVENQTNLGFAAGSNVGITLALADGADAVLLLNNDVEVAPDFVGHLVETLYSSPDIGAVNPKIYYHSDPNVIWSAGGLIDYRACTTVQRHINEPDTGQADETVEVDFAIGCAIMVKREVIQQAGMLDPDFFLYYEETEWCHRIRQAGRRIMYVPQSRVWHKVSKTVSGNPLWSLYYMSRNRLLFASKCGLGPTHTLTMATVGLGRLMAGFLVDRRLDCSRIVLKAAMDFYRGRYGEARL